tara:strand:- start:11 stop:424 length:414 start_codon:yes stop_codon:yes gene_type:complete
MLSESKIQRLYKYGTFITFGISIFVLFYPLLSPSLSERVWPAAVLNIGFHLMFLTLSNIPVGMYRKFHAMETRISNLQTAMIKIWVVVVVGIAIIGAIVITAIALTERHYEMLIILPVLFAVGLGALASWIKMNDLN